MGPARFERATLLSLSAVLPWAVTPSPNAHARGRDHPDDGRRAGRPGMVSRRHRDPSFLQPRDEAMRRATELLAEIRANQEHWEHTRARARYRLARSPRAHSHAVLSASSGNTSAHAHP